MPLRPVPAALDDPADMRVLVGKLAVGQIDARDLEQADVLGAELDIAPRRVDEARQQARAKGRELDRDRLGELPRLRIRVVRPQRGRVRLGETEPGERVLDTAPEPLDRRQGAEHRLPGREREGNVVEPQPGDLLDDVDLARHVAGAEGGHDDLAVARLELEALEPAQLLVGRGRQADELVGALRPV